MKTIDLHNKKETQAEGNLNSLFKEALTIEELFSIRGGTDNNDSTDDSTTDDDPDKKSGSDSDQQEDPLV